MLPFCLNFLILPNYRETRTSYPRLKGPAKYDHCLLLPTNLMPFFPHSHAAPYWLLSISPM